MLNISSFFRVVALAVAVAASGAASAKESVVINNVRYTCSNECNVTVTPTDVSVQDCCGGQVNLEFLDSEPKE
ncbi:hypothetical protein [Lysobacter enzymogenes]|uniref:hypothetical protein n=1 Tax=Lysobacter enzymogenes TaxID=69 RepID=UPI0011AB871E|nr:hypothetical protein [Lysobacter enzymogenes]